MMYFLGLCLVVAIALGLYVHLKSGYSLLRACDFKIHISIVILQSQDVRQNPDFFTFLNQPHGYSGNRTLYGYAGFHH